VGYARWSHPPLAGIEHAYALLAEACGDRACRVHFGGGCEITMHGSRVVAAAETYIGLVELGAGVIPAGAGTKEYMRRIINPAMKVDGAEVFPFIQKAFLQIGQAKVATSAEEARGMGIIGPQDRIVTNRDHLLTEAKKEVLHMVASGYRPPAPELDLCGWA
jgi:3-hydroxyacyl-CoA dehydrogenase